MYGPATKCSVSIARVIARSPDAESPRGRRPEAEVQVKGDVGFRPGRQSQALAWL